MRNSKFQTTNSKPYKIRLSKGDTVMVRSGKYKGKVGKISALHYDLNSATVEGLNVVKKHVKPNRQHPSGGIVEVTKPLPISKLGIYDSVSKKISKISYKVLKDGTKQRIYKTSGKEVKS